AQNLTLTSVELIPRLKLGVNKGVNKDFTLAVGYNIPLVVGATFGDSESSGAITGFTRNSGIDIRVGFSYHVDFAGPFTKMMSTPSKSCDALKP
ncbi:MAG: hypothetical protein OEW60_03790, partial [Thiovulaceae bacterium]|nr:hypothetical protein [Sulfurimonadaceae bacterium]